MLSIQLSPVILGLLILVAHFVRRGSLVAVIVVFAMLGLLAVRRKWAARVIQLALLLGALEWIRTMAKLASVRADMGLPATRMIVILGVVAGLTAVSVLVFRLRRVRSWFHLDERRAQKEIDS